MSEAEKQQLINHLTAENERLHRDREASEGGDNKLTFAWLAGILLTVVMMSGAWFTNTLNSKVDKLAENQSVMATDIAVIKNQVGTILKEQK